MVQFDRSRRDDNFGRGNIHFGNSYHVKGCRKAVLAVRPGSGLTGSKMVRELEVNRLRSIERRSIDDASK
jgi:hypothetical protein